MKNKMKLFEFQQGIIDEALKCLDKKTANEFFFQAPTGTGKTFITANLISQFIEYKNFNEPGNNYTFLYLAPSTGGLDYQGYEKITSYLTNGYLTNFSTYHSNISNAKMTLTTSMDIDEFKPNTVYFYGWDKLSKSTNRLTSEESEKKSFWDVLSKSAKNGTRLMVLIDEAHISNFNDPKKPTGMFYEKLINLYQDELDENVITIGMSATLGKNILNDKKVYKITYDQAVREQLVKKKIILNEVVNREEKLEDSHKDLLRQAIIKQKEIIEAYRKKNLLKRSQPLVLIQIPNGINSFIDYKYVSNILIEEGVNKSSIGIYLDKVKEDGKGNKINQNTITENGSLINYLIFKQAIATGWDIPRANMLVKLRDIKSETFEIQTIGRILRNPFLKYYNALIDNAYVFTDESIVSDVIKSGIIVEGPDNKSIEVQNKYKDININLNKLEFKDEITYENLLSRAVDYFHTNYSSDFVKKVKNINRFADDRIRKLQTTTISIDSSQQKETYNQIQFNLDVSHTLYEIYLGYKLSLINKLRFDFMNLVINRLKSDYNIEIKDIYEEIIIDSKTRDLINKIDDSINFIKNDTNSVQFIEYSLPNEISVSKLAVIENKIDNVNYYSFSPKIDTKIKTPESIFDSSWEKDLYKEISLLKNSDEQISSGIMYLVRNQANSHGYSVDYIKHTGAIGKFYPDFLIRLKESTWILDPKSRSDENYKNKGISMLRNITNLGKDVKFYFTKSIDGKPVLNIMDENMNEKSIEDLDKAICGFNEGATFE